MISTTAPRCFRNILCQCSRAVPRAFRPGVGPPLLLSSILTQVPTTPPILEYNYRPCLERQQFLPKPGISVNVFRPQHIIPHLHNTHDSLRQPPTAQGCPIRTGAARMFPSVRLLSCARHRSTLLCATTVRVGFHPSQTAQSRLTHRDLVVADLLRRLHRCSCLFWSSSS